MEEGLSGIDVSRVASRLSLFISLTPSLTFRASSHRRVQRPNILALNLPSVFGQSIAFLMIYQFLALLLLFFFREFPSPSRPSLSPFSSSLTHPLHLSFFGLWYRSRSQIHRWRARRSRRFRDDEGSFESFLQSFRALTTSGFVSFFAVGGLETPSTSRSYDHVLWADRAVSTDVNDGSSCFDLVVSSRRSLRFARSLSILADDASILCCPVRTSG